MGGGSERELPTRSRLSRGRSYERLVFKGVPITTESFIALKVLSGAFPQSIEFAIGVQVSMLPGVRENPHLAGISQRKPCDLVRQPQRVRVLLVGRLGVRKMAFPVAGSQVFQPWKGGAECRFGLRWKTCFLPLDLATHPFKGRRYLFLLSQSSHLPCLAAVKPGLVPYRTLGLKKSGTPFDFFAECALALPAHPFLPIFFGEPVA